jgi:hypothetical protein
MLKNSLNFRLENLFLACFVEFFKYEKFYAKKLIKYLEFSKNAKSLFDFEKR